MTYTTLISTSLATPSTSQAKRFSPKPIMASSIFHLSSTTACHRLTFSTKATPPQHQSFTPSPPPDQEKKSFAIATGEIFLGIASRILKKSGKIVNGGEESEVQAVEMFADVEKEKERKWWWRRQSKERIAAVVKDPVQPEVIWEQRVKDVEAELRRKSVTSPGFSFSAAGLLFPYHLGVAQFLIEKGYIKVLPP